MKRNLLVCFTALLLIFLVSSCKKLDTTDIGDDLIPAVDNVHTFDTVMDVITDNFLLNDSSRVLYNEDHAWGVIQNDPEFGKTKGEIFFAATPNSFGIHPFAKKDSTLIIDSVVLALAYDGYYGDSNSIQKVNIYEVSADAPLTQNVNGYHVDSSLMPVEPPLLGTRLVDFRTLDDSVYDVRKRDTLRLKNQLRIQLDKNLFGRFIAYDTTNAYKSDSAFITKFRGLAVKVDEAGSPAKNALAYFSLTNTNTKLVFYYRVTNGTSITDTLSTEFGFYTWNSANANSVVRTNAGNYQTYLNNATTSDNKIYLQSSPGSYATVKIPNLGTLSNRVIHRAELIFEALPSTSDNIYTKPEALFVDIEDTANKRLASVPLDFNYSSDFISTFGGLLKNDKYIFNVSRYIQGVVTRHATTYTFRISAPYKTAVRDYLTNAQPSPSVPINTKIASGRVVLTGGSYGDATKKARLRIIYSKI